MRMAPKCLVKLDSPKNIFLILFYVPFSLNGNQLTIRKFRTNMFGEKCRALQRRRPSGFWQTMTMPSKTAMTTKTLVHWYK